MKVGDQVCIKESRYSAPDLQPGELVRVVNIGTQWYGQPGVEVVPDDRPYEFGHIFGKGWNFGVHQLEVING